jgi:hypothetical protein
MNQWPTGKTDGQTNRGRKGCIASDFFITDYFRGIASVSGDAAVSGDTRMGDGRDVALRAWGAIARG